MAFIQLESDNPQLSFLLRKNPASGMIVKQLRQGLLFGYYSRNNPTQFNCWFKDHDSQVSYDADKEFEFNDVTRYSAATFVNNCFDEFFHDVLTKDQDDDTAGFRNEISINCMRSRPGLFEVFDRSFHEFSLEYEPLATGFHRVRIRTNQRLRKLLSYASLFALINAIQNREMRFVPDDLLVKYAKFIQYLDAPYFVRYIFKANLVRREETFAQVRQYLETDAIKLMPGHNFRQRLRFIERNLAGETIIDVGCGEGQYFHLAKKTDKYYAVDRDEQCLEQCRHRVKKRQLNNIELFESLDDLPPIFGRKTLLLTEVIEHNTQGDAFALIRRCLLPETRILITTPNRDFNVYYKQDDEDVIDEGDDSRHVVGIEESNDLRHEGHLFEFSDTEFREFLTKAVEGSGATIQFFNLGDCVNGITPQSAAIVDVP